MKYSKTLVLPLLFCAMLFVYPNSVQAQVTIGSSELPLKGALLDLTELPRTNAVTSTKGLGLPRVILHSADTLRMGNSAAVPPAVWGDHAGLLVYNTNAKYCAVKPLYEGINVWNGENWDYVGRNVSAGVKRYTNQEGNTFTARLFGSAGIWMTENVAVKSFSNGNAIALYTGNNNFIPQYAYPSEDMNGWNIPPTEPNKDGLLYNWPAAANSYNPGLDVNQGQTVVGDTPGSNELEVMEETLAGAADGKIQGICPYGWHLPSDREWNQLERELYNNPEKYSRYVAADLPMDPSNPTWKPSWDTENAARGSATTKGHGVVIRDQCQVPGSATSLTALEGGLAIRFSGLLTGGITIGLGDYGYYWTASTSSLTSSWYRFMDVTNVKVTKAETTDSNLFSVRCKKDVVD